MKINLNEKGMLMEGNQQSFVSLIEHSFKTYSNRTAIQIVKNNRLVKLSYEDLSKIYEKFNEKLKILGLEPGSRVAILSETLPESIVAILSIFANHCTAVLLDPSLPDATLIDLIDKSESTMILTSNQYQTRLESVCSAHTPIILLEKEFNLIGTMPASKSTSTPNDILIIIFTSGTAGVNQGVMISEKAILNQINIFTNATGLREDDLIFFMLPLNHIAPLMGMLCSLTNGANTHIVPKIDSQLLLQQLPEVKPTIFPTVPRVIELMDIMLNRKIAELPKHKVALLKLFRKVNYISRRYLKVNLGPYLFKKIHAFFGGKLRFILTGSAPFQMDTRLRFEEYGISTYFGYGLTETTNILTLNTLNNFEQLDGSGKALPGVAIAINQPNEKGVGEILVQSPCMMTGYLNNKESTEKMLIDGWLYTGDLGYIDNDNNLHVTGRIKEIIVTEGGKKVAPQFIELQYGLVEGVQEYAVFGVPYSDNSYDNVYAAVIIDPDFNKSNTLAIELIKENFNKKSAALATHLRIQKFIFVDALPKTVTLKIKRVELRKIVLEQSANTEKIQINKPKDSSEENISEEQKTIREFLRNYIKQCFPHTAITDIDDDKSFFELGMDSLMVTDLCQQLESFTKKAGSIPISVIIENPSITKLSHAIMDLKENKTPLSDYELPPLQKTAYSQINPVSLQQLYWLERQKVADLRTGYISLYFTVTGNINFSLFKNAAEAIIKEQNILRTVFFEKDASFYQKVADEANIVVLEKDLITHESEERALQEFAAEILEKKADFQNGPLGGIYLVRLKQNRTAILIAIHHLIFDGLSVWVLLTLLDKYYQDSHALQSPLTNGLQYADFTHWQINAYQGKVLNHFKSYWETLLKDSKPFSFPADHHDIGYKTNTITRQIPIAHAQLTAFLQKNKGSAFCYYYLTFLLTAAHETKTLDITVSVPQSGRFAKELNSLIGFFASTCLSRVVLAREDKIIDAYTKLSSHLRLQNEYYLPYQLVKDLLKETKINLNYDILFSYLKPPFINQRIFNLPIEKIHTTNQPFHHDILWYMFEYDNKLSIHCTYNSNKFNTEHINRLLTAYERMLNLIFNNDNNTIGSVIDSSVASSDD